MQESEYPAAPEGSVRLNKFLASCGYESRRAADRLIAEGRVEVNGKVVETPGLRVMPTDFVKVDGRHATPKEEIVLLLNKPRGFVCSRENQGAIGTVYDLLPPKYKHVNYIGRLDTDSEGLLLFTNSGALSQRIAHPGSGIEKEYWVTLDQAFDNSVLIQLLKGVRIPEGQAKAKYISRLSARRACVVLEQGLKRQVRQMFACLGLRVRKLVRVRIGSLWGGDLEPGRTELLTPEQIELATTNPRRRKGLIGAKQAFKPRSTEEEGKPDTTDEDEGYIFNPADFETEEEALGVTTKFDDSEAYEPERSENRRPFGRAPRAARDNDRKIADGKRRPFGNRPAGRLSDRRAGSFRAGERRGFSDRQEGSFRGGERRGFGDRREENFRGGERRSFGSNRREGSFRGGERRAFGEKRSFGEHRGGSFRGGEHRSFGEKRSFGERKGGSSFSAPSRQRGERKSFSERPSFGGHKNFRRSNTRRPYDRGE